MENAIWLLLLVPVIVALFVPLLISCFRTCRDETRDLSYLRQRLAQEAIREQQETSYSNAAFHHGPSPAFPAITGSSSSFIPRNAAGNSNSSIQARRQHAPTAPKLSILLPSHISNSYPVQMPPFATGGAAILAKETNLIQPPPYTFSKDLINLWYCENPPPRYSTPPPPYPGPDLSPPFSPPFTFGDYGPHPPLSQRQSSKLSLLTKSKKSSFTSLIFPHVQLFGKTLVGRQTSCPELTNKNNNKKDTQRDPVMRKGSCPEFSENSSAADADASIPSSSGVGSSRSSEKKKESGPRNELNERTLSKNLSLSNMTVTFI